RPARSKNLIPKCVSSRRICWLTADDVMCRCRAAAPTEPVRATASRVSRAGNRAASIMKPSLPFDSQRLTGLHDHPPPGYGAQHKEESHGTYAARQGVG